MESFRAILGDDSAEVSFSWPVDGRIWGARPSRLGMAKLALKDRGDFPGVGSFAESFFMPFEKSRCGGLGRCRGVMLSPRLRTVSAPVGVEFAVVRSGRSRSVMSVPREGGGGWS